MNTTQVQQKALDGALVASVNRLEFRKCNMRLKTDIKPKEATFQMVLDALALTPLYRAFLITSCPKIPGQVFEDLPPEHNILSFIRDLGHTGDITYLTDVNGMFHKKNIDYVYLLREDLLFQIENKDAKKTHKMSYLRFTKIIIDYFMLKDQSISRRNKMFWHTTRDDTMFTSMRCISRHADTQVYGTILPRELKNQAMLESKAYQTYYAFASRKKAPKPKYIRKEADSETSPKKKLVQAAKGTRLKSKAKMAKPDKKKQPAKKTKAKGLAVLSEVALSGAKQLKLATKRSKKDFHMSYASGSGDGVDIQSKVPDEQQQKTSNTDEGTDSEEEGDNDDDADNDDDDGDSNDHDDDNQTEQEEEEYDDEVNIEEEEKIDDEESIDEEEDDEVTNELYDYVNVNLGNKDTDMTIADQGASDQQNKTGDPTQSSSVSSDFTSKLLNLDNPSPVDNEIASLMVTTAQHATTIPEITSSFTTPVPPPPPFLHPLQQEATPIPSPTTSETTTSLPALPNFISIFKFNERVFNLEKDVLEIKQVDQYAQALSSIPAIVDHYMGNKLGEAINKAILAHNLDCKQEAQDEKNAYIELVDTTVRTIIKEEVNTQLPQILP
ncbi:hypothetical protein Tco_0531577 [Tanacetum coccineum]